MNINKHIFGILGYGYVGRATHLGLLDNQSALIHDTLLGTDRTKLLDADTVFVCLPTSRNQDLDVIIEEIQYLVQNNPQCQIILRSTVPLGTCKKIENVVNTKIIYIPEFLRERYWEEDCQRRPLIIGTSLTQLPEWLELEDKTVCSLEEAELTKMFSNNFAVVRIAFANLFYDLAQTANADYDLIKEMWMQIAHNQSYMDVPGHDGTRGFGGKCLPKDLDFLIETIQQRNLDSSWLENVRELNKKWQEKF